MLDSLALAVTLLFAHLLMAVLLFGCRVPVLVKLLRDKGFLAAATHFDRRGAVRSNASWKYVSQLLTEHFRQK